MPETIAQKKAMLKKHHVALWDVLDSCTIVGASDTSIEDPVVNNIKELVKKSKVTRIFCTGDHAAGCRYGEIHDVRCQAHANRQAR